MYSKPVQMCSNVFKLVQNLFKWVQTCSKVAQMSSDVFKCVQNLFKCVKCAPACPKLVQMCLKLFKNYKPFQCMGSDMTSRAWSSFNWSARFSVSKWKNLLSQRGAFLYWKFREKLVLVGCNLFFILVLKVGRTS